MTSTTRVDLRVSFAEKDDAKRAGARWDAEMRVWYAPPGIDLGALAKWLPAGAAWPAAVAPPSSNGTNGAQRGVSLSEFLWRVRDVVQSGLPTPEWVRAELIGVHEARQSGHVYLTLAEHSDQGDLVAQTDATIWRDQAKRIRARFVEHTGGDLRADIKVLVQLRASFHVQHGFALTIQDIDPSYTLGDLLAKLQRIRQTLASEGIAGRNKALPAPVDFTRVAVVSPESSAGLGDFRRESDRLHQGGLCRFDYFPATFQGVNAASSVREAVEAALFAYPMERYDALVIIRGGGSVTDLAWLNDLELARAICLAPIPVFTGIGHERDMTILDEVAHRRFDTPSKVALHVAHTIRDNAREAIKSLERIRTQVRRVLTHERSKVSSERLRVLDQVERVRAKGASEMGALRTSICASARHQLRETRQELRYDRERVAAGTCDVIGQGRDALQRAIDDITRESLAGVATVRAELDRIRQVVRHRDRMIHQATEALLEQLAREIAHRSEMHEKEAARRIERLGQMLLTRITECLYAGGRDLEYRRASIVADTEHWAAVAAGEARGALELIKARTTSTERSAADQIEAYARTIVGMGPQSTLQRGYAIARGSDGTPVGSKADALQHRELTIQFKDGQVEVENREYTEGSGNG